MKRILITTVAAVMIFTLNGYAQEKMKLSLDECIELALKNNHDFKKIKLDQQKAEEQVREAYGSSLMPSIDGQLNYNRAIKKSVISIETPAFSGTFPSGTDNTLTGSVSLSQPIFSGAMFLAIRIANTFANISETNTEYSRTELVVNIKEAYYNFLLSKELVKLAELQRDLAEKNMKDTESMYSAGLVSEYDFIKADVQFKNMIPAVKEAEIQQTLANNALKLLIGVEGDKEIYAADSLYFRQLEIPSFEEGLQNVYHGNKLLQQLDLQANLMDLNESYQFSQHLPKIDASGSYQAQAQENDTRHFNEWRYRNSFYVGLTLKVPIFKGFTIDSKVQQAKIDYMKSEEDLAKTKSVLTNNYKTTRQNFEKSEEQVNAYKATVEQADKGFSIAKKRFNTGLATQLEVTSALVELTSAKVNYLMSLRDYYLNYAKIDFLMGVY